MWVIVVMMEFALSLRLIKDNADFTSLLPTADQIDFVLFNGLVWFIIVILERIRYHLMILCLHCDHLLQWRSCQDNEDLTCPSELQIKLNSSYPMERLTGS